MSTELPEITRSVATSVYCAFQHALTPLCHFVWHSTCSQLLPLCYNATSS
ncbi:unnamed protein product [Staurois parvus]|uniref:Uncharacterized protein n=1 Tax=Staurois parvus TaxID=386267 RepID=A0ABN9DTK5_9NEOB|nr:unnamed protein product [Staurois parvus]